ncbi:Myosin type-2 heavy chain 1 [Nowakowskiella sp. JEL0078]|nr:Myosin type-2 heavy chain 1 [Nowakowskiella sp. JEL0078]
MTTADMEREKTYNLSVQLNTQLDDMGVQLTQMISEINYAQTATGGGTAVTDGDDSSNTVNQIVRILDQHLASLQWLDKSSVELADKVRDLKRGAAGAGSGDDGFGRSAGVRMPVNISGRRDTLGITPCGGAAHTEKGCKAAMAALPEKVERALSQYDIETEVWVPDLENGWILAVILEKLVTPDSVKFLLNSESGSTVNLSFSVKALALDPAILPPLQNPEFMLQLDALDNLSNLTYLHEPAVFSGIKMRFENERIYTYSGIVLIAVNPFRTLDLYSKETMRQYSGMKRGDLDPHLYAIAEDAYRNMLRDGKNQSIIVSGESGAGKTVAAKFVMRFFATIADIDSDDVGYSNSTTDSDRMFGVEDAVLSTNPIMEPLAVAINNALITI